MAVRDRSRWRLATAGLLAGLLLASSGLLAQAASTSVAPSLTWSQWLQNFANVMKIGELSALLFSAYQFWAGRRERQSADAVNAQRAIIDGNYQAWQVINSAQGKGGSGGRLEALSDLLRNKVSLAGINLDDAWLEGGQLMQANLTRGSLRRANLSDANLSGANLAGADLTGANLVGANLTGAYLKGTNLANARLSAAILDGADLDDMTGWEEIASLAHASIEGVRHAPPGFVDFARDRGAVDASSTAVHRQVQGSFSTQFRAI